MVSVKLQIKYGSEEGKYLQRMCCDKYTQKLSNYKKKEDITKCG